MPIDPPAAAPAAPHHARRAGALLGAGARARSAHHGSVPLQAPEAPPSSWAFGEEDGPTEEVHHGARFETPEPPSPLYGFGDEDLPTAEHHAPPGGTPQPSRARGADDEGYLPSGDDAHRADSTDSGWNQQPTPAPVEPRSAPAARPAGRQAGEPMPPAVRTPATPAPMPFIGGDDVFGGFDAGGGGFGAVDEAPTEEVPSAVLQDLSHLYSAPMDMPGPAPMPGLFGDETPPPVPREAVFVPGNAAADEVPSYVKRRPTPAPVPEDTPPRSLPRTAPPVRAISYDEDDDRRAVEEEEEEEERPFGLSKVQFFGLMGSVCFVALVIILGAIHFLLSPPDELAAPVVAHQVVQPVAPPIAPPVDPVAPVVPVEVGTEAPVAPPVAPVAPRVAPPVHPRPAPVVAPVAPPPARVPAQGTVKVRSNKAAIVLIDGVAVSFAPVEQVLPAGEHKISAALPGNEASKQTVTVTVQTGKVLVHEFSF